MSKHAFKILLAQNIFVSCMKVRCFWKDMFLYGWIHRYIRNRSIFSKQEPSSSQSAYSANLIVIMLFSPVNGVFYSQISQFIDVLLYKGVEAGNVLSGTCKPAVKWWTHYSPLGLSGKVFLSHHLRAKLFIMVGGMDRKSITPFSLSL